MPHISWRNCPNAVILSDIKSCNFSGPNEKENEEFGSVLEEILIREWSEKGLKMVNVTRGPLKPRNLQRANTRFKALKNAIPENPNSSQRDKIS